MKNANITATGQAVVGNGSISGVIVCSHTSGTLKLVDSPNGASGRVVLDTYTFATGSGVVIFPGPLEYYEGLYATVGGTGVSLELIQSPNT